MVASVNRWWEETKGEKLNRERVRELLKQIGLSAGFFDLESIVENLTDITLNRYDFEPAEKTGGWLIYQKPHGDRALAVPADPIRFSVGSVMTLVNRMFEGCGARAEDALRLERVYRACRLRAVGGRAERYEMVSRGYLLLRGDPDPGLPRPEGYATLLQLRSGQPAAGAQAQQAIESHSVILRRIHEQVQKGIRKNDERYEEFVRSLREELADIGSAESQNESRLKDLTKTVNEITEYRNRLAGLPDRIDRISRLLLGHGRKISSLKRALQDQRPGRIEELIDQEVRELEGTGAKPQVEGREGFAPVTPEAPPEPMESDATVEALAAKQRAITGGYEDSCGIDKDKSRLQVRHERDLRQELLDTADRHQSVQPPQEKDAEIGPVARGMVHRDQSLEQVIGDWKQAAEEEFKDRGGEPGDDKISPTDYVRRLLRLNDRLLRLVDASRRSLSVAVVHIRAEGDHLRIHATAGQHEGNDRSVRCVECEWVQGEHLFAMFLLVEDAQEGEAWVLIPLGSFNEHKYPSAYRMLMEDVPGGVVRITSLHRPALLRMEKNANDTIYTVLYKMQVSHEPKADSQPTWGQGAP